MTDDSSLLGLAQAWASAWSSTSPDDWVSHYTPTATYTDHAFLVSRTGTDKLKQHFNIWKHSMQDFKMTVADSYPAKELKNGRKGFTFRTHNTGTFVNDLVKRKASGKKFWFLGVVDFVVDQQGKIESVNEWYCTDVDAVEGMDQYR